MANITYRVNSDPAIPGTSIVKGAPLTNVEVDANFRAIDIEVDQLNSSTVRLTGDQTIGGTKTFTGNVGIGTSSPQANLEVSGSNGPTLRLSSTVTNAAGGQQIGALDFFNSDADIPGVAAYVRALAGPTHGVGGQLIFGTQETWATGVLRERLRIGSDGNVTATGDITAGGQFIGNVTGNAGTVTNGVYTTGDQTINGTKNFTGLIRLTGDPAPVGTAGSTGILEVGDPSGNTPATMSFHKQGYAINMGLDADNVFRLGGWSQGLNVYRWTSDTSGNFTALGNITAGGSINAASYNGGQLAGMRNKIINGKMEIAQRGTSFAAIANGAYSLDRWLYGGVGSQSATISRETDVPSSNEFQNSLRMTVTTADTSLAPDELAHIIQRIEGFNVRDLIGRTFVLSFWVRSSKTGVHCVSFRNGGGPGTDRSFITEYTINAANTWEFKTVSISGGLITAGANWNWTTGTGLDVGWTFASGSTFQTTAGAWQTGNFIATANQVNCLDTVGNIFAITGVQLEVGSAATPFEHRPIGAELALCQRYHERIGFRVDTALNSAANFGSVTLRFASEKRATPTITRSEASVSHTSFNSSAAGSSSVTMIYNTTASAGFVTGTVFADSEL